MMNILKTKAENGYLHTADRALLHIKLEGEAQADLTHLANAIDHVPPQSDWYSCGYNAMARCLVLNGVSGLSYADLKRNTPCRLGKIQGPLWPGALAKYVSRQIASTGLRAVFQAPPTWDEAESLMRRELAQGRPVIALVKGRGGTRGQFAQHYRLILSIAREGYTTLETDGKLYNQTVAHLATGMRMNGPVIGVMRGLGLYDRYNVLTLEKAE